MAMTEDGIVGEQMLAAFLKERGIRYFQPDAIIFLEDKYEVCEVKHQARYNPPPFWGHGLPVWQVEARLRFQYKTGIRCKFYVFDKETGELFTQYLDLLEFDPSDHIDTNGAKPRRIYNIDLFDKIT